MINRGKGILGLILGYGYWFGVSMCQLSGLIIGLEFLEECLRQSYEAMEC